MFIVTTICWIIYSFAKALKESLQQINNSSYHELCSLRSDEPHEPGEYHDIYMLQIEVSNSWIIINL